MKALLRFIWDGCWHRWKTDHIIITEHLFRGRKDYNSRDYILRCDRCGIVTRKNLAP